MTPAFTYRDRTQCVCGQKLTATAPLRTRQHAWGPVSFRQCTACASWCQTPEIEPASIAQWYDSAEYQGSERQAGEFYANYLSDESARLDEARSRLRRDLAPLLPPSGGEVLEIGCATGSQLVALRDAGHWVRGIDLSARFVAAARQLHGLDVAQASLESASFPADGFDLIILLGTISNLSDLPAQLRTIARWLKQGGSLVANFPAADSFTARCYGARYWMFAPTVRTFLSRAGCAAAIESARLTLHTFRRDVQQPSWQKGLTHSRLPGSRGWLGRLSGRLPAQPLAFPVPGIRFIVAQKSSVIS